MVVVRNQTNTNETLNLIPNLHPTVSFFRVCLGIFISQMENNERDNLTDFDLNLDTFGLPAELEDNLYYSLRVGHNPVQGVSPRPRNRWRRRRPSITSSEARNFALDLIVNPSPSSERMSQVGEGSVGVSDTERTAESSKAGKGLAVDLSGNELNKDEDKEKINDDEMSFFDCNICFGMANDPVITFCGHLFCWPCLYQWLHVYSKVKLCPVCQIELTDANITPIYGRGNNVKDSKMKQSVGVPPRPQAQRVESFRQSIQRAVSSSFQIEEMIQRIGRRFDAARDGIPPRDVGGSVELLDRAGFLASQILASGRIRREGYRRNALLEQSLLETQDDVVDVGSSEAEGSNPRPPLSPPLWSHSQTAASVVRLSSALSSHERVFHSYILGHHMRRHHTRSPPLENGDSLSSISSSVVQRGDGDADAEIDLVVPVSSSDASRASFVDTEVFRALRRRRLN